MTLIIGVVAQAVAHQVGDRLVSTRRGRVTEPYDPLANKQIVVVAKDAVVSIGYTGLAYLGDRATDEILAEAAAGHPVGAGMTFAGAKMAPIYRIAERIAERLDNAVSDRDPYGVETMIVGLKRGKRNRTEPLLWSITKLPKVGVAVHRSEGTPYKWKTHFTLDAIGEVNYASIFALVRRIKGIEEQGDTRRDAVTRLMVETIRGEARSKATVGEDCMVVRLWRKDGKNIVDVDYQPVKRDQVQIEGEGRDGGPFSFLAAYSPWFVSAGFVAGPAVVKGGGWDLGHTEFRIHVPDQAAGPGPRAYFGSQPRKPPPR